MRQFRGRNSLEEYVSKKTVTDKPIIYRDNGVGRVYLSMFLALDSLCHSSIVEGGIHGSGELELIRGCESNIAIVSSVSRRRMVQWYRISLLILLCRAFRCDGSGGS
jgi:hypothetical protein